MCGEGPEGAHTGNLQITLRALAAQKTLPVRGHGRCYAAVKPVIGGKRGED